MNADADAMTRTMTRTTQGGDPLTAGSASRRRTTQGGDPLTAGSASRRRTTRAQARTTVIVTARRIAEVVADEDGEAILNHHHGARVSYPTFST